MQKVKQVLMFLESKLYAFLKAQMPVVHAAWETALGVLISGLVVSKSSADVKLAVGAAIAVFLATLKASYLRARS